MKFLIVGLGSLGKRRIRNLKYLQSGTIIGFDPRLDRRDEASQRYRIQTVEDFFNALAQDPDVVIVSTPPLDDGVYYALEAARDNKHFFTEVGVVDDYLKELVTEIGGKNLVAAPSCTMRFHPGPRKIRQFLQDRIIGDPLTFTYHSGRQAGDWNLCDSYSDLCFADYGSQVCQKVLPFELVWLKDLFGHIQLLSGSNGRLCETERDNEKDVCHLQVKFESGVSGHLLVDAISRVPIRHLRIVGSKGNIEWNNQEQAIKIYSGEDGHCKTEPLIQGCVENMYINPEEPYVEEMRSFLEAVYGFSAYPYTFAEYQRIWHFLHQVEKTGP